MLIDRKGNSLVLIQISNSRTERRYIAVILVHCDIRISNHSNLGVARRPSSLSSPKARHSRIQLRLLCGLVMICASRLIVQMLCNASQVGRCLVLHVCQYWLELAQKRKFVCTPSERPLRTHQSMCISHLAAASGHRIVWKMQYISCSTTSPIVRVRKSCWDSEELGIVYEYPHLSPRLHRAYHVDNSCKQRGSG